MDACKIKLGFNVNASEWSLGAVVVAEEERICVYMYVCTYLSKRKEVRAFWQAVEKHEPHRIK